MNITKRVLFSFSRCPKNSIGASVGTRISAIDDCWKRVSLTCLEYGWSRSAIVEERGYESITLSAAFHQKKESKFCTCYHLFTKNDHNNSFNLLLYSNDSGDTEAYKWIINWFSFLSLFIITILVPITKEQSKSHKSINKFLNSLKVRTFWAKIVMSWLRTPEP